MIALDTTSKLLEIVLSTTVTANQLDFTCVYYDVPAQTQEGTLEFRRFVYNDDTNNATDVTLVPAPSIPNISREIESIFVYNKDTADATLTIKLYNGSTDFIIVKKTLAANETLVYERGQGWAIF